MFKIYVGNLDPRVTIEQVRELFAPFAVIEDAVLVNDAKSGKAKGFAIVMVRDAEVGRAAVKATQGKRLLGKTLTINEVMKKGAAAAKAAKEIRQGPFGPHFNRQGGGRATGSRVGGVRRGVNRGPRGPAIGGGFSGPSSGFGGGSAGRPPFGRPPGSTSPGSTNSGPTNPGPTNPGPTNPGPTNPPFGTSPRDADDHGRRSDDSRSEDLRS